MNYKERMSYPKKQMMWGAFHGKEVLPRSISFRCSNLRWTKEFPEFRIKRLIVEMKDAKHVDIYEHEYKIIKKPERKKGERLCLLRSI